MSKKKIIKLAAFALIGYGVYKAFFAEDNDVSASASAAANSGSGSSRGNSSHYVSGRGEVSDSEYAEIRAQAAAENQQKIEELTERLETSSDESEKVAIQHQLNLLRSTTSHR